jgi:hypothetical protein
MRRLKPAMAMTLLFLAAPRGGFPQQGINFTAPADQDIQQNLRVGEPFAYSLCLGRAVVIPGPGGSSTALNPAQSPCGSELNPSSQVTGGNGPYHFELETMGGFPPMGLVVDVNGVLRGTPSGTLGSRFRVCAVDMSGARSCETITLPPPQPAAAPNAVALQANPNPPKKGMGMRPLAVVLGLGAAAVAVGAASQLATVEDTSTSDGCPSFSEICGGGASGACGVPASCGCAGARDMGIVTQNVANATRGMCTVGARNCSCQ